MTNDIFQKFKDIILNPVETFKNSRDEPLGTAFLYFLVIIAVYSVLSGIVSMMFFSIFTLFMPGMDALLAAETSVITGVVSIVFGFIASIIALIFGSVILHIFVYILGGRKGIEQTIKASIYSCTPLALFGWIPFIGIIAIIWSYILNALAIRELHEISTARAVLAVLIPLIILIVLVVVALIAFLTVVSSSDAFIVEKTLVYE